MKADGLFVIMAVVFIFIAWVATGGPTRPIAQSGPFITPVGRSGEESQGYRSIVPANPINIYSYPKQVGGSSSSTISGGTDRWTRPVDNGTGSVYLERSSIGPYASDPNLEYVTLINDGAASVSVGSWRVAVRSSASTAFIPPGVSVPPGGKAVLVTGHASYGDPLYQSLCSYGSAVCVSLNRTSELYASSGETITLIDARGRAVDSYSY